MKRDGSSGLAEATQTFEEEVESSALEDDGEDDDEVGGGEDPGLALQSWDGEGQGDGEATAEPTPAQGQEGGFVAGLEDADEEQNQSDDGEADEVYRDDGEGS